MLSELPPYKKIPVHKPFITDWKPGEIYLYQIKTPPNDPANPENSNRYVGWWIILYVISLIEREYIVKGITDVFPLVYVKMSKEKPISICDINNADFAADGYDTSTGAGYSEFLIEGTLNKKISREGIFWGRTEQFLEPEYQAADIDEYIPSFELSSTFAMYAIRYYETELRRKECVKRVNFATWKDVEQRLRIYKDNEILSKADKWEHFIKLYRKLENEDEIRKNHTFVTPWLPHDTYICKLDGKEISEDIYMVIYVVSLGTVIINNEKLFLPNISVRLLRGEKDLAIRLIINCLPDVCFGVDDDGTPLYKVTLIDKKYDDTIEPAGKCAFYLDAGRYGQEQHLNEECMEDEDSGKLLMTWDEIVCKAVETYKTL
ncbi:MAG: hypothetical protein K2N34_14095 [Lachnospiraceae bacterium]|nr:hypothetical protein [Lachnospiraceae bacterium]